MKNICLFIVAICLLVTNMSTTLLAQNAFKKYIMTDVRSDGVAGLPTPDNGYLILGNMRVEESQWDMYLTKLNENAETVWTKSFEFAGEDKGLKLAATNDGNYLILGETYEPGNFASLDIVLIKCDVDGNILWSKTYGSDDRDIPASLLVMPNDDIVVGGTTLGNGEEEEDLLLLYLNSNGDLTGEKVMDNGAVDFLKSISLANDGGLLVTATANYGGVLIKLNADGSTAWNKYLADSASPCSAIETPSNEIYIIGTHVFPEAGATFLAKIDNTGTIAWSQEYWSITGCSELQRTQDGSLFSLTSTPTFGGAIGMGLTKFRNDGSIVWTQNYDVAAGFIYSYGSSLKPCPDNGWLLVGSIPDDIWFNSNYVLKTDPEGGVDCDEETAGDSGSNDFPLDGTELLYVELIGSIITETLATPTTATLTTIDDLLCSSTTNNPSINTQIKIVLEGAYNAIDGTMTTHLNNQSLVPNAQPFNRNPWNYEGTEFTNSPPDNTVDWVLVEVRDANNNDLVLEQRAALLLANGTLQDVAGVAGVNFTSLTAGEEYFVSVKTRNHVAVLSANTIELPNTVALDLSNPSNVLGGAAQLAELADGSHGLYAGDFNSDGVVTVSDYNYYTLDVSAINVYIDSDLNFNDNVTVSDFNLYQPNASIIGVQQIRY